MKYFIYASITHILAYEFYSNETRKQAFSFSLPLYLSLFCHREIALVKLHIIHMYIHHYIFGWMSFDSGLLLLLLLLFFYPMFLFGNRRDVVESSSYSIIIVIYYHLFEFEVVVSAMSSTVRNLRSSRDLGRQRPNVKLQKKKNIFNSLWNAMTMRRPSFFTNHVCCLSQ